MDFKYIFIISHISSFKTELSTILNNQMVFLRLDFWASQRVRAYIMTIQVNHWAAWTLQLHLGGYFSPPTRVPPITGLQYLLEHHRLVFFEWTQPFINQMEFDYIYLIGLSVCLCRDLSLWPVGLQITKQRLYHWANWPLTQLNSYFLWELSLKINNPKTSRSSVFDYWLL